MTRLEELRHELKNIVFKSKEEYDTIEHIDYKYSEFFEFIDEMINASKEEQ